MWFTWPWSALQRGRYIELVRCRMFVHQTISSAGEEFVKGDEVQVRPMVRRPSVSLDCLYNCSIYSITKVLRPGSLLLNVCLLIDACLIRPQFPFPLQLRSLIPVAAA